MYIVSMGDKRYFSGKQGPSVREPLNIDTSGFSSQEAPSQTLGCGLLTIGTAEELASRMPYPSDRSARPGETSAGELTPRTGYPRDKSARPVAKSAELPPRMGYPPNRSARPRTRSTEEPTPRMEYPPQTFYVKTSDVFPDRESFHERHHFQSNSGRDDKIRIGQEFPSSTPDETSCLRGNLLGERVIDIANQLLLVNEENIPGAESSDFTSSASLNDISLEYLQLYADRRPENYDFALNIMAFTELLNDNSWETTVSYFDENVKRMIQHIWSKKLDGFYNMIDLQRFNREMVIKLMLDFTQWSINNNFDLEQFLNYSVLMCQLGVIARKHIFKEAPLYAIDQLRARIKFLKFEHFVQFMFEVFVKDYAKRLFGNPRV